METEQIKSIVKSCLLEKAEEEIFTGVRRYDLVMHLMDELCRRGDQCPECGSSPNGDNKCDLCMVWSLSRSETELVHASSSKRVYCEHTMAAEERGSKAELEALKKDARMVAMTIWCPPSEIFPCIAEAAERILEATKESNNG